jgi:hypothetical protein
MTMTMVIIIKTTKVIIRTKNIIKTKVIIKTKMDIITTIRIIKVIIKKQTKLLQLKVKFNHKLKSLKRKRRKFRWLHQKKMKKNQSSLIV